MPRVNKTEKIDYLTHCPFLPALLRVTKMNGTDFGLINMTEMASAFLARMDTMAESRLQIAKEVLHISLYPPVELFFYFAALSFTVIFTVLLLLLFFAHDTNRVIGGLIFQNDVECGLNPLFLHYTAGLAYFLLSFLTVILICEFISAMNGKLWFSIRRRLTAKIRLLTGNGSMKEVWSTELENLSGIVPPILSFPFFVLITSMVMAIYGVVLLPENCNAFGTLKTLYAVYKALLFMDRDAASGMIVISFYTALSVVGIIFLCLHKEHKFEMIKCENCKFDFIHESTDTSYNCYRCGTMMKKPASSECEEINLLVEAVERVVHATEPVATPEAWGKKEANIAAELSTNLK